MAGIAFEYFKHMIFAKKIRLIGNKKIPDYLLESLSCNETTYGAEVAIKHSNYLSKINNTEINVNDLGAGSKRMGASRKISEIVKHSVSDKYKLRFLSKLVFHLKPEQILELGTSLAVSALALSLSSPQSKVLSIEGCRETHLFALSQLKEYNLKNLNLVNQSFSSFLKSDKNNYDFVIIDGDHTYKSTLELFSIIDKRLDTTGVLLIDDINWSPEMLKAWKEIKKSKDFMIFDFFDFALMIKGESGYERIRKIKLRH